MVAAVAFLAGCAGGGEGSTIVTGRAATTLTPNGSGVVGTTVVEAGTSTTTKPTITEGSVLTTVGLDKVHFGMTLEDAEKAAGTKLVPVDPSAKKPACFVAKPERGPDGLTYIVSDGRVEQVAITAPKINTRSGAHVGSTEADVQKLYPSQIDIQNRPDALPGHALVFVPKDEADAKYRVVFLTDGTVVTEMRGGRAALVTSPTPCS